MLMTHVGSCSNGDEVRKHDYTLRESGSSAIHFAPMAYPDYENQQPIIFDFADDAVIANAIFPVFSEFRTLQPAR